VQQSTRLSVALLNVLPPFSRISFAVSAFALSSATAVSVNQQPSNGAALPKVIRVRVTMGLRLGMQHAACPVTRPHHASPAAARNKLHSAMKQPTRRCYSRQARLLLLGASRAVFLLRPSVSPWPLPTAASDSDDPVYR